MAKEETAVQKRENQGSDVERTRSGLTFSPYTDIWESKDTLTVSMDLPGVKDEDVDIHLENDVLSISAKVEPVEFEGFEPLYTEYRYGDYQRSFRLIGDFDSDKIAATLKNGVLTLSLPKSEKAKPKKITVNS